MTDLMGKETVREGEEVKRKSLNLEKDTEGGSGLKKSIELFWNLV